MQSRRHEGLERDQICDRVQISNRTSHLPMYILVTGGEDVWDLAAFHSGHDGIIKLGLGSGCQRCRYLHRNLVGNMACLQKSSLESIDLVDGLRLRDDDRIGSEAHHCAILTV